MEKGLYTYVEQGKNSKAQFPGRDTLHVPAGDLVDWIADFRSEQVGYGSKINPHSLCGSYVNPQ